MPIHRHEVQRRGSRQVDSIFERLDVEFGFEGAFQHSVSVKGADVSRNTVRQMLKNWKKQGLIVQTEAGRYRKSVSLRSCVMSVIKNTICGWDELPPPSLYPRKHCEILRAVVSVMLGIGIQFRVKPSLLKPLEGAEAIVTKVTKADGKERELESRYTQSYRPKKADG